MVVQSADAAKDNAKGYNHCTPGQCLYYVRTWLEIPSRDGTASAAWYNADKKHVQDRNPPPGVPVFWLGGSQGYGHIGLSMSDADNTFRGTDMPYSGDVSTQPLNWIDQHWGASMNYAGWTEDLNGITIPYADPGSKYDHGDVYVDKLKKGQKDSDSVGRLCYRLMHHDEMPGTHTPPNQTDNYGEEVLEAVRWWQRNVMPKDTKGPTDGTSVSNPQANRLFGSNYTVHEK